VLPATKRPLAGVELGTRSCLSSDGPKKQTRLRFDVVEEDRARIGGRLAVLFAAKKTKKKTELDSAPAEDVEGCGRFKEQARRRRKRSRERWRHRMIRSRGPARGSGKGPRKTQTAH